MNYKIVSQAWKYCCYPALPTSLGKQYTVCPGSSDPPEKIFNIFASENEGYTIYQLLQYLMLNIIRLQSKIILGHMNLIG